MLNLETQRGGAVVFQNDAKIIKNVTKPSDEPDAEKEEGVRTNLSEVVMQSLADMHFHLRCANVEARTALDLDLPLVLGDHAEIFQSVQELILDSVNAAESGGAIQVITFATDGRDPRLGKLPPEFAECSKLAVVEVRDFSARTRKALPAICRQAAFQVEEDRTLFILPA